MFVPYTFVHLDAIIRGSFCPLGGTSPPLPPPPDPLYFSIEGSWTFPENTN